MFSKCFSLFCQILTRAEDITCKKKLDKNGPIANVLENVIELFWKRLREEEFYRSIGSVYLPLSTPWPWPWAWPWPWPWPWP